MVGGLRFGKGGAGNAYHTQCTCLVLSRPFRLNSKEMDGITTRAFPPSNSNRPKVTNSLDPLLPRPIFPR